MFQNLVGRAARQPQPLAVPTSNPGDRESRRLNYDSSVKGGFLS